MISTTIIQLIAVPIIIILFVDAAAAADRTDSSLSSTYEQLSPSQQSDSIQPSPPTTSMSGCVKFPTMVGRGLKSSSEQPEAQIEFLDLSQILDASKHEIEQINRDINTSDEFKPFLEDLINKRESDPRSGPAPVNTDCRTFSWDVRLVEDKLAALETKLDRFLSKFQIK
jgi:hypothetical protein